MPTRRFSSEKSVPGLSCAVFSHFSSGLASCWGEVPARSSKLPPPPTRPPAAKAARREVAERLLATRDTIARTQRQIVDHVLVLHEVLLADAIEDRRRRERAEAVRRAEARRAIAADVERRRDLVRVRVREA